jgi:pilus assembly protein CpaC
MYGRLKLYLLLFFLTCGLVFGEVLKLENLTESLSLTQGESCLLLGAKFTKVISGNPDVLEVIMLSERELILHSKKAGATNLIIQTQDDFHTSRVTVAAPRTWTPQQITSAIGLPSVKVSAQGNVAVLDGNVNGEGQKKRAEEIARLYAPQVLNYLQALTPKEQIAIKVRIVEISKKSWNRLGVLWGTDLGGPEGQPLVGLSAQAEFKIAAALHLLEAQGEAKLISEPALLSIDGGNASFLAGGEVPIPMMIDKQLVIHWKTYGTKLDVSAKMEGELIRVRISPEVSSLDGSQGISVGGSFIPALTTRRTQTEIYLPSGGTVVIAGLGQQYMSDNQRNIPWWAKLPHLGKLFRHKTRENSQAELAIFLTAWRADGLPEPNQH